jgi:type I restriction enzyme S subunit
VRRQFTKRSIASLCTLVSSGGTPYRDNERFWANGTIPWFKTGELNDGWLDDSEEKITEEGLNNSAAKMFPVNTVLMAMYGDGKTITSLGILRNPATTNQACCAMIADPSQCDYRFLFYKLMNVRSALLKLVVAGAQRNLSARIIKNFEIEVPEVPLQAAIADILSAYDDLIENNRRRIALLEQAARMLYREWFVYFRFPGHEHVKIIDGLPEGWEGVTLGQVAETNNATYGAKDLPEQINYIDISSVTQGRIESKTVLSARDAPGRARRRVKDGDVIWSNVRPNLRAYALVLQPNEADVFSTGFTVLSGKSVPFSWLYLQVTTDGFVGHLINHATGAGYPAVRPDDFQRASVLLPPRALLDHFHNAAEPNFRLIAKLEQQNLALAQARDLLLPRLMSGEIAV